jgi:hypothetical protein
MLSEPEMTMTTNHTMQTGGGDNASTVHEGGDLVIDCGTCVMRRTDACTDCMVTFLLESCADRSDGEWSIAFARNRSGNSVQAERDDHALVFDLAEQRAMRTLTIAGLLPELRYQANT